MAAPMKTKTIIKILFLVLFLFGCSEQYSNEVGADKPPESAAPMVAEEIQSLSIASFNIQFLGHFKKRNNEALASLLKDHDIVVVQELVAPPTDGTYPDAEPYTADAEASAFFEAMKAHGFEYMLSEEDTGTNDEIHKSTSSTEWWVSFYKPEKVNVATDLPHGYLADDRSNHDDYERVPYAFPFRSKTGQSDFVFISVHLQPGDSSSDQNRRKQELGAIASWVDANDEVEKDFIILGDMNIKDAAELSDATPSGFLSLNDELRRTNTLINSTPTQGAKPYDHIMYNVANTQGEIDIEFDMNVIDLIEAMRSSWTSSDPYPGDPYDHNLFKQYYSDHHPVEFKMIVSQDDD